MPANDNNNRVPQSILDNYSFLQKISKTKSAQKQCKFLRQATDAELCSIIECAFNVLKGRFKLTKRQKNRILPHLNLLRRIGRARTKRGLNKAITHHNHQNQIGSGLQILPALLTPILIEAFRLLNSTRN